MNLDEYRKLMDGVPSAWRGLEDFAVWLVERVKPQVTVELGVNLGFSLFALALPNIGRVVGVDSFEGRTAADIDDKKFVFDKMPLFPNAGLWCMRFDEARREWGKHRTLSSRRSIDILHIDGHHHYDAILNDYTKWATCVRRGGVVLLHDTVSAPDGVGRLFRECESDVWCGKAEIKHSCGLGIIAPRPLLPKIKGNFRDVEIVQ